MLKEARGLLLDWLYVVAIWERLKPILAEKRKDMPQLWENFEALAKAQSGALVGTQS